MHWHFSKRDFETSNRVYDFGGGEDKSGAEAGIQAAGEQAYQRSKATPEETAQYGSSFELGKLLDQITRYQQGLGQAPSGYLSPEQQYQQQTGELGRAYYGQVMGGVKDPYGAYESALQPALQLAQNQINQQAQQRGLLRSGIPIQNMGSAGVELAVKEAADRMNFRSQELARGGELINYQQNVGQQNLSNMSSLYGQQQGYGQGAMNRQASAAQNAAQYQAYPYQAQLGNVYGSQGNQGAAIGGGTGAILGAGAGLALAPLTAGTSMAIAPWMGALLGGSVGGVAGSQFGRGLGS